MNLLDNARLTDEEMNQAYFTSKGARSWQGEAVRDAADAQLAKALWAAYDFLDGLCMAPNEGWRACSQDFYEVLTEAGIERP